MNAVLLCSGCVTISHFCRVARVVDTNGGGGNDNVKTDADGVSLGVTVELFCMDQPRQSHCKENFYEHAMHRARGMPFSSKRRARDQETGHHKHMTVKCVPRTRGQGARPRAAPSARQIRFKSQCILLCIIISEMTNLIRTAHLDTQSEF